MDGESLDDYAYRLIAARALEPREVSGYLDCLGYKALDGATWDSSVCMPSLWMRVHGHEEVDGHTYYAMTCKLTSPGKAMAGIQWKPRRRLAHLRTGLHDPVKRELGRTYADFFAQARFARRGGPPGTTQRLDSWCKALARCIERRGISPIAVAAVFKVLGAPCMSSAFAQQGGGLQAAPLGGALRDDGCPQPPICMDSLDPQSLGVDPTGSLAAAPVQDGQDDESSDGDEDHLLTECLDGAWDEVSFSPHCDPHSPHDEDDASSSMMP